MSKRILGRRLARELTQDEASKVTGGCGGFAALADTVGGDPGTGTNSGGSEDDCD